METDEKGIVTIIERNKLLASLPTTFSFGQTLEAFCQAQHGHDVEVVKRVLNPIQGRVFGDERVRQNAWDECQEAILRALKAEVAKEEKGGKKI